MKLLDGVAAVTDGDWFHITEIDGGKTPQSIKVEGISNATVTFEVSNGSTRPTGAEDEIMTVTADDMLDVSSRYDWYRARVTVWVSGTITVTLT